MRIFQDKRYVNLIARCDAVITAVSGKRASHVRKIGCVQISANWKHWIHAFPQHGPGPKHTRPIRLEAWQVEMVTTSPKPFLAGLVHSDGCRFLNPIRCRAIDGGFRRYSYPRYSFSNASDDIRRLFTDTCELLGVRWTQMNARNVAVSRQADVAFLDTFIGPKS